jgi:hypothetical protein
VRYFHGCHSIGGDTLWGVDRAKEGTGNTVAALNFGPLRQFTVANSHHRNRNHTARTRALRAYCAGATPTPATPTCSPPDGANAPRIRSDKGIRGGGRPRAAAA